MWAERQTSRPKSTALVWGTAAYSLKELSGAWMNSGSGQGNMSQRNSCFTWPLLSLHSPPLTPSTAPLSFSKATRSSFSLRSLNSIRSFFDYHFLDNSALFEGQKPSSCCVHSWLAPYHKSRATQPPATSNPFRYLSRKKIQTLGLINDGCYSSSWSARQGAS